MRSPLHTCTLLAGLRSALLAVVGVAALASVGHAATITLRSGNAAVGLPDPNIRYLSAPVSSCGLSFPSAFSAADFAAAQAGPNPIVVTPYGPWATSLPCDPLAQWIALDPNRTPHSMLFAYTFVVPEPSDPCCADSARLSLCWTVDDWLGDLDNSINSGAYLNGTPLGITGGNYATQTNAAVDVTGILHCGVNTLYMYDRDAACVVSGLMFSARIDYVPCIATPTNVRTWGSIKALYR